MEVTIASVASKINDREWNLSKLATDKYMQDTFGIAAAEVAVYRSKDTFLFPALTKISLVSCRLKAAAFNCDFTVYRSIVR